MDLGEELVYEPTGTTAAPAVVILPARKAVARSSLPKNLGEELGYEPTGTTAAPAVVILSLSKDLSCTDE